MRDTVDTHNDTCDRSNDTCDRSNDTKEWFLNFGNKLHLFEKTKLKQRNDTNKEEYQDKHAVKTLVLITEYLNQPEQKKEKQDFEKDLTEEMQANSNIIDIYKGLANYALNIRKRKATNENEKKVISFHRKQIKDNRGSFPFIPNEILPDRYNSDVFIDQVFQKDLRHFKRDLIRKDTKAGVVNAVIA